jgi:hypothetical protein
MKSISRCKLLCFALSSALLAACASSDSGVPSSASALQGAQSRIVDATTPPTLSGEYSGKFVDGVYGVGKAKALYSQSQNGVGGLLTVKYTSAAASLSVALVASGNNVDGTSVAGSGSLYCTFSVTSKYDSKAHAMKGSYSAVYGCTGDKGTFTLRQHCYFQGASGDARPDGGVKPC